MTTPPVSSRLIALAFDDPTFEANFRHDYAVRSLPFVRIGLGLSALLWPLSTALISRVGEGDTTQAYGIIYGAMLPVLALAGALTNFQPVLAMSLMMTMVFAFAFMRFLFWSGVVGSLPYIVGYVALTTRLGIFSTASTFLLVACWCSGLVAVYLNERTERRAYHQRQVVLQQRAELTIEREKSERLLLNILPASIAAQLKEDSHTIAEHYPEATVLFADIVGFTPFSAGRSPQEVVRLLDLLFSGFDQLAEKHGLEKIKTIGDAYMAVSGVPIRREDHARAATAMALEMISVTERLARDEKVELGVRIGVHSGPLIAGVIGKKKFMYDLWGDTVNTASRMESHGLSGKVHITETTWKQVDGLFAGEHRGEMEIKGKGLMRTLFVRSL